MTGGWFQSGRSHSRSRRAFQLGRSADLSGTGRHHFREPCEGWQGDPYPTTHPYMGKNNSPGPKYGYWTPHPYLTDMDTLTRRFGSWADVKKMELETPTGVGNLHAERSRLGMGGVERGPIRYPPIGLCNDSSTIPTLHPRHICNLDLSEDAKCPFDITIGKPNLDWPTVSRPGNPWYCTQRLRPEQRSGSGLPNIFRPHMPPAGVSTSNDCPLAWRYHPANLSDPNLKRFILHKTLGQFTNPTFHPRPGDILILQRPREHAIRDAGFVQFYTANHHNRRHLWNHGDQIVRLGKLVDGSWKMCKDYKLFKLIQKTSNCSTVGRWMITGLQESVSRELSPLLKRRNYVLKTIVPEFWPRRGDLLLRLDATSYPSQLDWAVVPGTGPSYRPGHGDIILRVFIDKPASSRGSVAMAGSVEMFLYDGKGIGWVFMGRDESIIDATGQDLLEAQHHH